MGASALLERLEGVRRTGEGRWVARCPAHGDRSPSLSIRELPDGRVLVHDFAGCALEEILGAAGVGIETLFPPRAIEHAGTRRAEAWPAADVLRALAFELEVVLIVVGDVAAKRDLTERDLARLDLAAQRIRAGVELALGR